MSARYNVGGVLYPRPFKVRRLGHFGFNLARLVEGVDFYGRLLGFRLTDELDLGEIDSFRDVASRMADRRLFFMTHGSDHHALVLADRSLGAIFGDDAGSPDITVNQITWQVGTLEEVVRACAFFQEKGVEIRRMGRDMPGSNWHVYVRDPDGHTVELYYGIEQVGWDGQSKPRAMYDRRFDDAVPLPQMSEAREIEAARQNGVDVHSGHTRRDPGTGSYPVGGVLLPRPFKITRIGPVALFVRDVAASEAFYVNLLGFVRTEAVTLDGHHGVFLRNGTEHHSLALFPRALRAPLGLSPHTSCMTFGLEVGSYQQLRDAVGFLEENGARLVTSISPELYPGIDYAAHVLDPEGHCLQLYCYMEQVGWDGKPRPRALRRVVGEDWPATIEPLSDTYADQTFPGPLG